MQRIRCSHVSTLFEKVGRQMTTEPQICAFTGKWHAESRKITLHNSGTSPRLV